MIPRWHRREAVSIEAGIGPDGKSPLGRFDLQGPDFQQILAGSAKRFEILLLRGVECASALCVGVHPGGQSFLCLRVQFRAVMSARLA